MRIAVVGSGVTGLVCAHELNGSHEITLFEADRRIGGHVNTVAVHLDGEDHQIDTGFIVYNEQTYPNFCRLLERLGVATQPSEMSFSVSGGTPYLEYRGDRHGLLAQPTNLMRPSFVRMILDIPRLHRALRHATLGVDEETTLGDFVWRQGFHDAVVDRYLVPMTAAIWSADPGEAHRFPVRTVARFLENHGLLNLRGRPMWRTIAGGSRRYVDALTRPFRHRIRLSSAVRKVVRRDDRVEISAEGGGPQDFDAVVLATHSDDALRILADASPVEQEILGSIRYTQSRAVLHTDSTLMPRQRRAWASWNFHLPEQPHHGPTITYSANHLQKLRSKYQLCVTLNREVNPARVIGVYDYAHPILDAAAVRAQRRIPEIQGVERTFYCGAYAGYGFHEDAVNAALEVVRRLSGSRPGLSG